MGKDPSTATKLEDEIWGLGDDAYATILDVYHQVHCLNSLRKLVYPDYYNKPQWQHSADPKAMFEIHMEHCVDLLLQALQCSGNANLITLHWVEREPYPFPDMSLNRKCVDFDALTKWRLENTIDMEKYKERMDKPKGVKQLKQADGYYKYFRPDLPDGHQNTHHPPP
ncbi:hypothetical protein BU24DRAFT_435969 [Aaosphaeria arxii CBS 175.79]|uniref:Tat pathway signal sequence n=1 Tax=Aaosphaeria arxii CBS 175.79 TaxID=1450172 RepID=A0A6A5XED9_9PLEO|nr:uncharacterized protein BU24DRAFT_435969 [Aaosphaeria arxii CBS 175.79]KAF2011565.1 hypothetical protein BU24DRAFT_435969 [Aaosphaeria arxii CBS 175.79]